MTLSLAYTFQAALIIYYLHLWPGRKERAPEAGRLLALLVSLKKTTGKGEREEENKEGNPGVDFMAVRSTRTGRPVIWHAIARPPSYAQQNPLLPVE